MFIPGVDVPGVVTGSLIGTASVSFVEQTPAIALKQILTFSGDTPDGKLVEAVAWPWFEILKRFEKDPTHIYELTPRQWEEIIAGAYSESGFFDEVILTPASGDKGRDVIATKLGMGAIRVVDQMKASKPGHVVTADDVRSMAGVLLADPSVTKGYVTTTSSFAPRLMDDLKLGALVPFRIQLRARDDLLGWLKELTSKK